MRKDLERDIANVRAAHEEWQLFAKALMRENERLSERNAELESEISCKDEKPTQQQSSTDVADDGISLGGALATTQAKNARLTARYVALQNQSTSLLNRYVVVAELYGTVDRSRVLSAIQEIIADMVGSREVAIFERAVGEEVMSLVVAAGIEQDRYRSVPTTTGAIARAAQSGEIYLGGCAADGDGGDVATCIPLCVGSDVRGVIAIFQLLSQPPRLRSHDLEIFTLLRRHAGVALYCAELHAASRGSE